MEQQEIMDLVNEARFVKNVEGNPKKAVKLCDKILRVDADNRDAMLIKAGALNETYNFDESKALIDSIIKRWPTHWEAYYLSAMNHFSVSEDEKALELIDKSVELDENFNNIISKAQMLCLMGEEGYTELIEKAKRIDKKRAENFMKNLWIDDIDSVKPTFKEMLKAVRAIKKGKIHLNP